MFQTPQIAAREFHTLELGPTEVGLRYENGTLVEVLPPNTCRWYWRGRVDVRCVVVDIGHDLTVARSLVPLLLDRAQDNRPTVPGAEGILAVRVPDRHSGLLTSEGKVVKRLGPGLHAFWQFGRDLQVQLVDWGKQEAQRAGNPEAAAA